MQDPVESKACVHEDLSTVGSHLGKRRWLDPVSTINPVISGIGSSTMDNVSNGGPVDQVPTKGPKCRRLVGLPNGVSSVSASMKGGPLCVSVAIGESPDGTRKVVEFVAKNMYAAGGAVVKNWDRTPMQWCETRRGHMCEVSSSRAALRLRAVTSTL